VLGTKPEIGFVEVRDYRIKHISVAIISAVPDRPSYGVMQITQTIINRASEKCQGIGSIWTVTRTIPKHLLAVNQEKTVTYLRATSRTGYLFEGGQIIP